MEDAVLKSMKFIHVLPRYHKCKTKLEKKVVPVDPKVFSDSNYNADYCPKCKLYVYKHGKDGKKGIESKNPVQVGGYITMLQMETNMGFCKVPYPLLEK